MKQNDAGSPSGARPGKGPAKDVDLRDDRLSAHLREAHAGRRAPRPWVEDALAIPARAGRPAPARESWLPAVFPHLAGLLVLGGFVLAFCLRPQLMHAALEPVVVALERGSTQLGDGFWPVAGILTPVVLLLIEQGARGFPILRRLGLMR